MRAMMTASCGTREFRNDTQRRGKLDGVRRGNGRFENSSGNSGRQHLRQEVSEEQKFRSVEDGKLRVRRYKVQ
jgi:hypothetical protein